MQVRAARRRGEQEVVERRRRRRTRKTRALERGQERRRREEERSARRGERTRTCGRTATQAGGAAVKSARRASLQGYRSPAAEERAHRSDADDDGDMMDDSVSRDGAPRISESGEAATLRFCGCLNFREGLRLRGDLHVQRRISLQLLSHQLTDSARSCLW